MKGWGMSEGSYSYSGGGWAREVQCKRRIALDSFLRAANESAAGPAGGTDSVGVVEREGGSIFQQRKRSMGDLVDREVFSNSRSRRPPHEGAEGRFTLTSRER